jgi:hypothetical protein
MNEDPDEHSKQQLRAACNDVSLDEVNDKIVYGNSYGFRVLQDVADLGREVRDQGSKIAVLEQEVKRLRAEEHKKFVAGGCVGQ